MFCCCGPDAINVRPMLRGTKIYCDVAMLVSGRACSAEDTANTVLGLHKIWFDATGPVVDTAALPAFIPGGGDAFPVETCPWEGYLGVA